MKSSKCFQQGITYLILLFKIFIRNNMISDTVKKKYELVIRKCSSTRFCTKETHLLNTCILTKTASQFSKLKSKERVFEFFCDRYPRRGFPLLKPLFLKSLPIMQLQQLAHIILKTVPAPLPFCT